MDANEEEQLAFIRVDLRLMAREATNGSFNFSTFSIHEVAKCSAKQSCKLF
jgi:hypothetical protein